MIKFDFKKSSFSKFKRRLAKYLPYFKLFSLALIGLALLFTFYLSFLKVIKFAKGLDFTPKAAQERTNILILGMGGEDNKVKDLTDTIIFLSLNLKTSKTLMLSLPRDIWIPSMRAKINTAYHYGEEKKLGGGLILAKAAVSEILGQPIHYAVGLDFGGFVKAVDVLGGVEIEVERSFDDYRYPIPGKEDDDCGGDPEFACRYEHLHFKAGWQTMDGQRALKYVRSRNAEGEEGTDFARSRRQQRLLLAVRNKIFSAKTIFRPGKLTELIKVLKQSIKTDITPNDYPGLAKLALKFKPEKMRTEVLDFLINPPLSATYDFHWVLVPPTSSWQEVHDYALCLLEEKDCH
ncbi:MAG TPA: LCP family protein [Nevskiaceae bacterium]|nr:LCP family protein [Nevskiaceae bacterium]